MRTTLLNSKTKLYLLAGINRPITPQQVTKLAESIDKMGVIRPIVIASMDFIDGINKKYIIDGQHLFHALIRNNMDIPIIEIKINSKQDMVEKIALLNASSKSWTMVDYITSWCCIKDDYKKLFKYYNIYDFELQFLASILSGNTMTNSAGGNNTISKVIKKGLFSIQDELNNVKILDYTTDMLKIIPRLNRVENNYTCNEYVKFIRSTQNYNHKKFLERLAKNKETFVLATHEPNKLSQIFKQLNK
jgi:hypothetical protein